MVKINHFAALVAAIIHFAFGAVWFTTFAKPWMAGLRMTSEEIQVAQAHPSPLPYLLALICSVVMAYALAWSLTRMGQPSLLRGIAAGAALGIGIAAAAMATELAFEMRSMTFIAISAGYPAIGSILMGGILGAWRSKTAELTGKAAAAH